MQTFTQKAQKALQEELDNSHVAYDTAIAAKILTHYNNLAKSWGSRFELRPKQLLFSYLSILSIFEPEKKPLALGLGCGEGKQEGFGVALVGAYELLMQRRGYAKLLFITASEDLVQQMKDSLPLQGVKDVFTVDEDISAHECACSGIYLCDFDTFLRLSLHQKKGGKYKLFHNLDRIFVDEFHALLATSSHITAHTPNINNFLAKDKRALLAKFEAYKMLLEDIKSLKQTYPKLVSHSKDRYKAAFNPSIVLKEGKPLEFWFYKEYLKNKQNSIKALEINSFGDFLILLDTASDALSKELGKDYYLFEEKGNIVEYCTAQKFSAKPLPKTSFSDNTLAVLILLQHTHDLHQERYKGEFLFLARTYLSQTTSKITPLESVELHGAKNFTVASATLEGVGKQLEHLGFGVNFLQKELRLSLDDSNLVIKESHEHIPLQNHQLKSSPYTQIAITAQSAKTLSHIANKLREKELYGYEILKLYRNPLNPNDAVFEQEILKLQQSIYDNPLQKRIILIQGLGEGSNIFKRSANAEYKVKLYKLDIDPIDKVTQTRYRVGVKGRADGVFEHSFSLSFSHSSALTHSDRVKLKHSKDKTKTLLKIQEQILLESDDEVVVVHKSANNPSFSSKRRDALKTIAAATLLTTASNPIIELFNATFGKEVLHPSEAKASYNYKNIPPGIATCRDRAIIQAYVLAREPRDYYKGIEQMRIFEGIMGITSKHYLPLEFRTVKDNTPYIEPAYWYLCAMTDDPPRRIYKELEKKNPILTEFATGIFSYFREWVYYNKGYYGMKTEEYLLNSIFGAAYGEENMEKLTNQYLNADFEAKKRLIENTAKIFQNMRIDPKKNQINDNYDKALTAQWAAFWLVGHYEKEKNIKLGDLIFNLEQYGFKDMKDVNDEKLDLRVRGPPYYNF